MKRHKILMEIVPLLFITLVFSFGIILLKDTWLYLVPLSFISVFCILGLIYINKLEKQLKQDKVEK
jgi:ABC-type bacteriocin/lantibiotic exporter with double-glycine peptidase domain